MRFSKICAPEEHHAAEHKRDGGGDDGAEEESGGTGETAGEKDFCRGFHVLRFLVLSDLLHSVFCL